ncbi:MAG: hypothetical protein M1830_002984 [Pleopsidium flavum]|nr:MAG: hypothetical protein M1830_002984 [Pleopsidium flavum]
MDRMWKRVPQLNRSRDNVIGNPTLIETTFDEKTLGAMSNVTDLNNGDFSISARPAFGRKETRDVMNGLPQLPFRSLEPPTNSSERPVSAAPTASSIYSQSHSQSRQHQPRHSEFPTTSSRYTDVSPPDSPPVHGGLRDWQGSPEISPVDESPETPNNYASFSGRYNSSIPVPRKVQNGGKRFLSAWRCKTEDSEPSERDSTITRWDDFSGEPTTSERGKPAQVIPGSAPFSPPYSGNSPDVQYGNHVSIRGGPLNSHTPAGKASQGSRSVSGGPTGPREEWKGPSGRSAIVSPIVEKLRPATKSITVPPRPARRPSPTQDELSRGTTPVSISDRAAQSPTSFASSPYDQDDTIKPIVPLKAGRNSPPRIVTTPLAQHSTRPPYPSPAPSDTRSPATWSVNSEKSRNKPLPTPTELRPNYNRDRESAGTIENNFVSAMKDMNLQDQPGSRFSATTYATTNYDSPPDSPYMDSETPMPTAPSPLLNRKRPVPGGSISSAKATIRKPTPSEVSSSPTNDSSPYSKTLPQSPPEIESVDRISKLQAKLDNLHRRRLNLQTVIRELSQVIQPSSAVYDMASRREIKKTVEGLNSELAGVIKEEHEAGMKLHRAWKKRDKDDIWEPTGLWVRRVTG